jgi:uncharacterized membrane-anchored protein YjiN (DUF445 family)
MFAREKVMEREADRPEPPREPVGRWALTSLLGALTLAIAGMVLQHAGFAPFWTGLLVAFAEAALVGGLADWFAVRALFVHPFGIPFPHTALIPRNRTRIVAAIRDLVQHEWLPPSLLKDKARTFDFVGKALLPVIEPLRPHLRRVLRTIGKDLLDQVPPEQVAGLAGKALAGAIDREEVGPFLAGLVRRAREQQWLDPVVHELVTRLQQWGRSPASTRAIRARLAHAASTYRGHDWFKSLTYNLAEAFGGIDLDLAARTLADEVHRFAEGQLTEESQLHQLLTDALVRIETRLRDDPRFLEDLRDFLREASEDGTFGRILRTVLTSLKQEAERELDREDSPALELALKHLDGWARRLAEEEELRERVNGWFRRLAGPLIDRHHAVIGALVEEQLNRLTEENLSEVIQAKVGEDLNWIRLNGTFVGGLVGAFLYLSFHLFKYLAG